MKLWFRVLGYLKPYWKHLFVSTFCTVLFTIFSGAMVWLVAPTVKTVFMAPAKPQAWREGPSPIGGGGWLAKLRVEAKAKAYSLIGGGSKLATLKRLCLLIIVVVFLKNLFFFDIQMNQAISRMAQFSVIKIIVASKES